MNLMTWRLLLMPLEQTGDFKYVMIFAHHGKKCKCGEFAAAFYGWINHDDFYATQGKLFVGITEVCQTHLQLTLEALEKGELLLGNQL